MAANQHDTIQSFIQGTVADGAPVLPISAQLKYNVDAVCEYIVKKIPIPKRDFTSPPQMIVIRSFDVNKPGSEVEELQGGVAGGSILQACPHLPAVIIHRSLCLQPGRWRLTVTNSSVLVYTVISNEAVGQWTLFRLGCDMP